MYHVCSRVHDRTVSHIRYLPEDGLVVTLAFDNTMRIFNAVQCTIKCTVVNDTGGPFTGLEHDPVRSQVQHCLHCTGGLDMCLFLLDCKKNVQRHKHMCIVPEPRCAVHHLDTCGMQLVNSSMHSEAAAV